MRKLQVLYVCEIAVGRDVSMSQLKSIKNLRIAKNTSKDVGVSVFILNFAELYETKLSIKQL